jgi:hypothetical protein
MYQDIFLTYKQLEMWSSTVYINLQATGNDTCVNDHSKSGCPLSILVISCCVRYDIIIKTSNPLVDFLGVIKINHFSLR